MAKKINGEWVIEEGEHIYGEYMDTVDKKEE